MASAQKLKLKYMIEKNHLRSTDLFRPQIIDFNRSKKFDDNAGGTGLWS